MEEYPRENYVPFHKQFSACRKAKLNVRTKFFSFKEHPEFLPALPGRPKLKKFVDAIRSGEIKGLDFNICDKFGGICNGGHNECRKTRGLPPSPHKQLE